MSMTRPLCSLVMATFNRAHLLKRSLARYAVQDFPSDEFELIVIDDHSSDDTNEMVRTWAAATCIKTTILTPAPKLCEWRDCGAILNAGIRASSGKYILMTHPEVIPGKRSVTACVHWLEVHEERMKQASQYDIGLYACSRVYYLSQKEQQLIDTVPWLGSGVPALRELPGFYTDDLNGHPDYRHDVTDKIGQPGFRLKTWESWVFGGCSRETWKRLGGMLETQYWGSVDVAFMQRRQTLGMPNHTCLDDDTIVAHQNHDSPQDWVTPRDPGMWQRELRGFDLANPNKLKYPVCDYLGW